MNILKIIRNKKILSDEQLLNAMVYQKKNSISFLEALIENSIGESEKVLNIIEQTIESKKELSAVAEQVMGADFIAEIEGRIKSQSISLLRSLVELDYLNNQQCEQIVMELQNSQVVAAIPQQQTQQETVSDEPEISEAALESLRELAAAGNLDPEMLAELENQKKK